MASSVEMRGDSRSSSSGDVLKSAPTEGAQTELYRSRGAQVYLVDVETSVLMQTGDFVVGLANHAGAPLAALVAMVGDLQWPVGKDTPVIRVGDKCFTCTLHGLVYGLVLGEISTATDLQKLEEILEEYAAFQVRSDIISDVELVEKSVDAPVDYWTRLAVSLENMSAKTLQQGFSVGSSTSGSVVEHAEERGEAGVLSLRLRKRMQQMRRVSAVVKLFTKALIKGIIKPSQHVELGAGGCVERAAGVAVASVDAVTKLLEAVETAGRRVIDEAVSDWRRRRSPDKPVDEGADASSSKSPTWTLSSLGLRMLYGASASLISSGCVSRSSSDSSTSTSSGSRILSSASSTSNSASPPPFPSNRTAPATPSYRSPASSTPPPFRPPTAANAFRHTPPPLSTTSSLHRPTPTRLATAHSFARRPPFLPPPSPRPSDSSEDHSH